MASLGGIEHFELQGSRTGSIGDTTGDHSATRLFICDFVNAETLVSAYTGSFGTIGNGLPVRTLPQQHPTRPYLYARSGSYEPMGAMDPRWTTDLNPRYPKAKVTINYKPLDNQDQQQNAETYYSESREFSGQFYTLPGKKLQWKGGPDKDKAIPETAMKRVPEMTLNFTVNKWLNPNLGVYKQLAGMVNQGGFTFLYETYDASTLLFMGASTERDYTSNGLQAYKVTYKFKWRPKSWNFHMASDGKFYLVAPLIYEQANFNRLLPGQNV